MSLVARHLEASGIPTIVVGSARDIVEYCAVSRFLFVDFPLGNPCGKPEDPDSQDGIIAEALTVLAQATIPQTTVKSVASWGDHEWRQTYMTMAEAKAGAKN